MQSRLLRRTSTRARVRWLASSLISSTSAVPRLTVEDEILEDPVGVIDLEHLAGVGDDDGAWLSGGDRDGRVLLAAALCRQVFIIGAGRDDDPVSRLCLVQHRLDGFTGFDVKLGTVCAQDQR